MRSELQRFNARAEVDSFGMVLECLGHRNEDSGTMSVRRMNDSVGQTNEDSGREDEGSGRIREGFGPTSAGRV